jgi:hypothetical protein
MNRAKTAAPMLSSLCNGSRGFGHAQPSCQVRAAYGVRGRTTGGAKKISHRHHARESRPAVSVSLFFVRQTLSGALGGGGGGLRAAGLRTTFLAPAFLAGAFLVLFFATAFLADAFLATVFFAGLFLVTALRTVFLVALFFTEAFFAALFFAAAFFTGFLVVAFTMFEVPSAVLAD